VGVPEFRKSGKGLIQLIEVQNSHFIFTLYRCWWEHSLNSDLA